MRSRKIRSRTGRFLRADIGWAIFPRRSRRRLRTMPVPPWPCLSKSASARAHSPDVRFRSIRTPARQRAPKDNAGDSPRTKPKGARKRRIIYVAEEIAQIVRERCRKTKGRIFRDEQGQPWTNVTLRGAFLRLKNRLRKHGITPEEPFIPYTCRHTFRQTENGRALGITRGLRDHFAEHVRDHRPTLRATLLRHN